MSDRTATEQIILIGQIAHRLRQLAPDKIAPWTYETLRKYEEWGEAALGIVDREPAKLPRT